MITLQHKETIQVYQVSMERQIKKKESPFIAILILASEEGNRTTAGNIQDSLFGRTLPERACENLLQRLEAMGYFKKDSYNEYELTSKGIESAKDKSFWQGEKGVYNLYISNNNLVEQKLVKIERKQNEKEDKDRERKDKNIKDDRDYERINTPNEIKNFENEIFNLSGEESRIEKIYTQCFKISDENWNLQIIGEQNQKTVLSLQEKHENHFKKDIDFSFENILTEILSNEFDFDGQNIKINFDENNLNFIRDVIIQKPKFQGVAFEKTEIENIKHIPKSKTDAEMWYIALLIQNISKYFSSEQESNNFSEIECKKFKPNYNLDFITQKQILSHLQDKKYFYKKAKLETINFLTY